MDTQESTGHEQPTPSPVRGEPAPVTVPGSPGSLPAAFEATAARLGDRAALHRRRDGRWEALRWSEVAERGRAIAAGLAALGVERGDRVAVLSETRVEAVLADLGILAAGAAVAPIYQTCTPRECEHVLRDAGATLVFCDGEEQVRKVHEVRAGVPELRGIVRFDGSATHDLERRLAEVEALGRAELEDDPGAHARRVAAIGPGDLASLIYTSGTTGVPKGAVVTHGNWLHSVRAGDTLGLLTDADRCLLFLPLAHAFGKLCEVSWLYRGGELAFAERLDRLLEDAAEIGPTLLPGPPRIFEKLFGAVVAKGAAQPGLQGRLFRAAMASLERASLAADRGERPRADLGLLLARWVVFPRVGATVRARLGGRIRLLGSGAAPLSPRVARFFEEIGVPIAEGYGMTETAGLIAVNRADDIRVGSVGRPIPGVEVRIAGDGEVLVRGPNVMGGYWRAPDASAEALEGGWLHTGDVGELDGDGYLRITDRKKDVIVTAGGKKIAPQQVERELKAREPLLSHVIVHGDGRRYVTALVTVDEAAARRFAADAGIALAEPVATDPRIRARIDRAVALVNADLPRFATVKRHAILPRDLSIDAGELTPTLKVRRRACERAYRAVLDALYEE
jgi:long-chain acyl-CoA synthetase